MKFTIDRFEGNFAVVELNDQKFINVPKEIIPHGAKEGDIIDIQIDKAETSKQKDRIEKLMSDVWAD